MQIINIIIIVVTFLEVQMVNYRQLWLQLHHLYLRYFRGRCLHSCQMVPNQINDWTIDTECILRDFNTSKNFIVIIYLNEINRDTNYVNFQQGASSTIIMVHILFNICLMGNMLNRPIVITLDALEKREPPHYQSHWSRYNSLACTCIAYDFSLLIQ